MKRYEMAIRILSLHSTIRFCIVQAMRNITIEPTYSSL